MREVRINIISRFLIYVKQKNWDCIEVFRLVANRLRWRERAPIKTKQQARGDEVVTAVEVWHKSSEKGSIQKRSENVCEVTNASVTVE